MDGIGLKKPTKQKKTTKETPSDFSGMRKSAYNYV